MAEFGCAPISVLSGWSRRAPRLPPYTVSDWLEPIYIFKYVFNFLRLSLPMSRPAPISARGAAQPKEESGILWPPGPAGCWRGWGRGRFAGLRRAGGRRRGPCPGFGNGGPRLFPLRVGAWFFVTAKPFPSPVSGFLADKGAHAGPSPTRCSCCGRRCRECVRPAPRRPAVSPSPRGQRFRARICVREFASSFAHLNVGAAGV